MTVRHVLQFLIALTLPICLVGFFVSVVLLLFWFAAGEVLNIFAPTAPRP